MKRIAISILAAAQAPIVFTLGGMELVTGATLALCYVYTLCAGLFVYFGPWWKEGSKP